jgi:MYXO-CTERM domain-containing protein
MGLGSSCGSDNDCNSGDCIATSNEGMLCSMSCTSGNDSSCPDGFQCLSDGSSGQCAPGGGGGCCDAGGHGGPTALFGIALVGMIWRRRRRR